MQDLSKLPANVWVQLLPPAAGSGDLRPRFVVTQHSGQEDMLLDLDSSSDDADSNDDGYDDSDDEQDSAGMYPLIPWSC